MLGISCAGPAGVQNLYLSYRHNVDEIKSVSKKNATVMMEIEVNGKIIDLGIYVDSENKGIKYELTCDEVIEPLDALVCLGLISQAICEENGFTTPELEKQDGAVTVVEKSELH